MTRPRASVLSCMSEPPVASKHIVLDRAEMAKVDPSEVLRRSRAASEAKRIRDEREAALGRLQPFAPTRIIDLPKSERDRIDEAFDSQIKFNLAEPEPAIRAGAQGVPDRLAVDLGGSTVADLALIEVESHVPTHEDVRNSDGTITRVPLSPDERYKRLVKTTFQRAFQQENQSLADFLPQRVKAVWRITREMARLKGLAHPDEFLTDALVGDAQNFDPWQIPEPWTEPTAKEARRDLWPEVIDAFRASEGLEDEFKVHLWVANDPYDPRKGSQRRKFEGFGLLPPPIPPIWRNNEGNISKDYVPREDPNLNLFISAISNLAERLQIPIGAKLDPDLGRLGLQGLFNPALIRMCWPTRTQILTWEQMIVEETLELFVKGGMNAAKNTLRDKYGLLTREITALLRMANALAQEQTSGDREDARAIMILRLEEYIMRSKDALDLSAEMKGLKQLATVTGLSDAQHNDPMTEFLLAVREVAGQREAQKLGPPARYVENTAGQHGD